ncbi:MAG TPA: hypothetical protein VFW92_10345 [Candidatus Limnocylindrales bacterium]|nr:hypothetical protein [Candidatus Limnocylindrales bacterium]
MNRRVLSRGRRVAGAGAVLTLVACLLPWFRVGGDVGGLPAISSNALAGNQYFGAGIVVFVAAIAVLALLALPFAAGDQPLAVDRPASFVLAAGVGLVAYLACLAQLTLNGALLQGSKPLFLPDRAPGLWLAALGVVIMAWGAWDVVKEQAGW